MDRKEIDNKYKWDFSLIFNSDKEIETIKTCIVNEIEKLKGYEGKLNKSQTILDFLKANTELEKKILKLDLYASMKISVDTNDVDALRLMEEVGNIITNYSVSLAFMTPELSKLTTEKLTKMRDSEGFKDYNRMIDAIIREKPHTLDKEKEQIVAAMGDFTDYSGLFDKLCDGELKFEPIIKENGEKVNLTLSNYSLFIKDKNREIRRQASENLGKGYKSVNLTLTHNYLSYVKKCDFLAKLYKFGSYKECKFFSDEIDIKIYNKLMESLAKNNKLYQNYIEKKSKIMGIKDFMVYDVSMPLGDGKNFNIEYDEAVKYVKDTTKCFGSEYQRVVDRVFSERWVDVYPSEGKRNGAFSISVGEGNPFILLNYENVYRSISTIAHELGHSIHSYFSNTYQPYPKREYDHFVAEVASTTNEILLAKHILSIEKDVDARRCVLEGLIHEFNNNVFMAGVDAKLEEFAHDSVNKGEPITNEDLHDKYEELLKSLYGGKVKTHLYTKYIWQLHSQYYSAFYLYKYATGFVAACNIASNIEKYGEQYVNEKYIKFLSAGSSLDPIGVLKLAGIDMSSDETYKNAFNFYKELVDKL